MSIALSIRPGLNAYYDFAPEVFRPGVLAHSIRNPLPFPSISPNAVG